MRQCVKFLACALGAFLFFIHGAAAQQAQPKPEDSKMIQSCPIPPGQGASGIRFPYKENGKMKMFFNVDKMFRRDLQHIEMTEAKIVTYDDAGKSDITLLLPISLFDLNTRLLTTDKPFVMKKTNFEMMGDSLLLDTANRTAKVTGKVRMVIYNFDEPINKDSKHE